MLHVDYARWGQTPEDLRRLATGADHRRTRERFLALYEITQESCATRVAVRTGRHPQTVMEWLRLYNERGPEALAYRRTGGRPPFVPPSPPRSAQRSAPPSRSRPAHL
jgi:Winged helix-turn helix